MGSGLSQTAQTDPVYQEALAKISEAFDAYDRNNDGILSKREFLAIVNENLPDNKSSNTITDEDKEQWFVSLDRNNDGVIDRNEFKQWWTGNSDTTSKRAKGLDGVRTKLANKKGIFLGFTFAEYKKSKTSICVCCNILAMDTIQYLGTR